MYNTEALLTSQLPKRTSTSLQSLRGAAGKKPLVALSLVAALPLALTSLVLAPAAQANPSPCQGETFTTSGTCVIAAGETVAFTVSGAPGGVGGNAYGSSETGGLAGTGALVTGTYTNISGGLQTITVTVGSVGTRGADGVSGNANGNAGTPGGISGLAIGGSPIVTAGGGMGGTGAVAGNSNGSNGGNGSLLFPGSLPAGWTDSPTGFIGRVIFTAAPAPDAGSTTDSAPAAHLQQFPAPVTGNCDSAASESFNWAGVASGGWSTSWGQWKGYEGPVCTRTVVYSTTLNKWTVN